jgi:hypothetical protein
MDVNETKRREFIFAITFQVSAGESSAIRLKIRARGFAGRQTGAAYSEEVLLNGA